MKLDLRLEVIGSLINYFAIHPYPAAAVIPVMVTASVNVFMSLLSDFILFKIILIIFNPRVLLLCSTSNWKFIEHLVGLRLAAKLLASTGGFFI